MDPLTTSGIAAGAAAALSATILQKGLEISLHWFRDPSWRRALAATATIEAGIPSAGEAVLRWLQKPETEDFLVSSNAVENLKVLRSSLAQELADQWALIVGRQPEVSFDDVADVILTSVLSGFIAKLDPSAAVSVLDQREQARHEELRSQVGRLEDLIKADDTFEQQLRQIPSLPRISLVAVRAENRDTATTLLRLCTDPDLDPATALRQQMSEPRPKYLQSAPPLIWLALADLAGAYGARDIEAEALLEAVDQGAGQRGPLLARAAMAFAGHGDAESSEQALAEAKAISPDDDFVRLVEAAIRQDQSSVIDLGGRMPSFVHGQPVGLMLALAVHGDGRHDEAIQILRTMLAEQPEVTSVMIWLGKLLLSKAEGAPTGDEAGALRSEAMGYLRRARDYRRTWRAASWEAVEVMAQAAVTLGDRKRAFDLISSDADATPQEAEASALLAIRITLLLDEGDMKQAAELADRIDSPYFRLLANGALAADTGKAEEAAELLNEALDIARHFEERLSVVRYMATAGIWPLPDFEEIREIDPETAASLEATSALVRKDYSRAITVLRPLRRGSVKLARLLAIAYEHSGQLDEAVRELQDAARHFRAPELTAMAALVLSRGGRTDQAFNLAQRVALELPTDSPRLVEVRQLLFEGFFARRAWGEAEEQARRLLEVVPTSAMAGWALVACLVNQGRVSEAWDQIVDRRLSPRTEAEARTWLGLAARDQAATSWVARGLELIDQFPDSEQLHAQLLFASAKGGDSDLAPDLGERLRQSWSSFVNKYSESQILRPQTVGETDTEVLETFRGLLEPGAEAAMQRARDVEDGRAPLGLLSTATNRSYIEAWVGGGTGTVNIFIQDNAVNRMETAAAVSALDDEIVVDGSTLSVLSLLPELADRLLGAFSRAKLPISLRFDALNATDTFSGPSRDYLYWDSAASRPAITSVAPNEIEARRARARWIEAKVQAFDATDVVSLPDFPAADPVQWWWLAPLQLAKSEGRPFYCDDAWVRRLAASIGVPAFGTVDLLNVLRTVGQLSRDQRLTALSVLRRHRAVSLPITGPELYQLAADDEWGRGLASLQVAQTGFWVAPDAGQIVDSTLALVNRHNRAALAGWLLDAMYGATRNSDPNARQRILAQLLAGAISNYGQPDNVRALIESARAVAVRVQANDPLPAAAPIVRRILLSRLGHREATLTMVTLARDLPPDDSRLLTLPFFAVS